MLLMDLAPVGEGGAEEEESACAVDLSSGRLKPRETRGLVRRASSAVVADGRDSQ